WVTSCGWAMRRRFVPATCGSRRSARVTWRICGSRWGRGGFRGQVAAPALIGMEATGNCHWLVDLLAEVGHELWVGDAAQIRASDVRQQKTDKRDAAHILKLLVEGRFPRASSGAGADRHGSHRQLQLAGGFAGRVGPRAVGGRCGADSCQLRAAAEDGQARCGAYSEAAGRGAVSEDLDAVE